MVEVTQEDYDAAQVYADMYSESECYSPSYHQRIAEAFARHRIAAEQRGKIEGARLAIEAAERAGNNSIASHCTEIGLGTYFRRGDQLQETSQWWKLQRVEALVREMRDLPGQAIRALSPAKIVGEG